MPHRSCHPVNHSDSKRSFLLCRAAALAGVIVALAAAFCAAQTRPDSSSAVELPGIVVYASRLPLSSFDLSAAVTTRALTEHERTTALSPAALIGDMNGLRSYGVGNIWGRQHVDVRGFYGAGEAQYAMVTVDGIPINSTATGIANWNAVDLTTIDRIEVARGPASAEFGDFAFGGVIAFASRPLTDPIKEITATTGTDGAYALSGRLTRPIGNSAVALSAGYKINDGWRKHSKFESTGLSLGFERHSQRVLSKGFFSYTNSKEDIPGALTMAEINADRTASARDPFGNPTRDMDDCRQILAGFSIDVPRGDDLTWASRVYVDRSDNNDIRTITTPVEHNADLTTVGFETSLKSYFSLSEMETATIIGSSFEHSALASIFTPYGISPAAPIKEGNSRRSYASLFAQGIIHPSERLHFSIGARIENIYSRYEPTGNTGDVSDAHWSFYPRVALGLRPDENIHIYASLSRAFKAPTLKHLYDSAPIFNPMSGTYVDISNTDLEPMVGTNSEVGIKLTDMAGFEANLCYFYYRIRNEIDFDNATYSYRNIGRSRHSGVELSMERAVIADTYVGADLSYNSSVFKTGAFNGNQLNGVPKLTYRFKAGWRYSSRMTIALRTEGIAKEYIDQENVIRLPDWTVVSFDASLSLRAVSIHAAVENLLDKEYNVSGYFDPMVFEGRYYPAAVRSLTLSVRAAM